MEYDVSREKNNLCPDCGAYSFVVVGVKKKGTFRGIERKFISRCVKDFGITKTIEHMKMIVIRSGIEEKFK